MQGRLLRPGLAAGTLTIDQPGSASVDACLADLGWSVWLERVSP